MIADDMMSYIKSDIVVFGIGVFIFIVLTLWFIFRNLKWVVMPLLGCCNLSNYNDWFIRINWLESNSNFIKLYCINAYFKYGNEYSFNCKIFTIKKRISSTTKSEAVFEASKKMMLPILYTVLTTICAFLSLVFSGIKPIIDFGWMMTLGLIVSF